MINEKLGIIYVLDTLLDFAGEAKKDSINISTSDALKIIKILKQSQNEQERKNALDETISGKRPPNVNGNR